MFPKSRSVTEVLLEGRVDELRREASRFARAREVRSARQLARSSRRGSSGRP